MKAKDPHFPSNWEFYPQNNNAFALDGTTIRLEFIKAAMQGLCANPTIPTEPEFIAKHALILADATLRAAGVDDD